MTTEKTFQRIDEPYYLLPRAGVSRGSLCLENEVFGKTREELRELGLPEWFSAGHHRLEPRSGEGVVDWIKKRSGITERCFAPPDQTPVELGEVAGLDLRQKLEPLGIEIDPKVTGLILACATNIDPSAKYPARTDPIKQLAAAKEIAQRLGIEVRGEVERVFTVENGCAGTGGMLARADEIFRDNPEMKYLQLISAEKLSDILNRRDLGTTPLLGDAGGALLLMRDQPKNTPSLQALGHLHYFDESQDGAGILYIGEDGKLVMDGNRVFRRATNDMPQMVKELAEHLEVDSSKIKLILPHLANERILQNISKRKGDFGLENASIVDRICGENTSSQTIMRAVEIAEEEGKFKNLKKGDMVAITTVGLGWHGRCVILRYLVKNKTA